MGNMTSVRCLEDGYTFQALGTELECSVDAYCPMPPSNPSVFLSNFNDSVVGIEARKEGETVT